MPDRGVMQFTPGDTLAARMAVFEAEVRAPGTTHAWTFTLVHRVTEETAERGARGETVQLDNENLVMAGGPMCYRCESVSYNKYPCPGYRDHKRTDEGHFIVDAEILEEEG